MKSYKLIEEKASPRLISTGDIKDIHELCLASEGVVVCKFRLPSILSAVASLFGSFYCFNMEFPKSIIGGNKKTTFFLEYMLLGQASATLPLFVEHVLSGL